MTTARREALTAFRRDPLHIVLGVERNLTGAALAFALKAYPEAPTMLLALTATATPGAQGIRLVDAWADVDGVWWSILEIIATKQTMATLSAAAPVAPSSPTTPTLLSYDLQWTLADDGSGLTTLEETVLFGDFYLQGSVND